MNVVSTQLSDLVNKANHLRDACQWQKALASYLKVAEEIRYSSRIHHNIGLCYLGLGNPRLAIESCNVALNITPQLWQSLIVIAKAHRSLGNILSAEIYYRRVLLIDAINGDALLGLADLEINEFGNPLYAKYLIRPLRDNPNYNADTTLTDLMASIYDRDESSESLTRRVLEFSATHLQLDPSLFPNKVKASSHKAKFQKIRVGLLSPSFCVSPVYFLTINFFIRLAEQYDIVIFNRGGRVDWATEEFKKIAQSWHDLSGFNAESIANTIMHEHIDILYDLGGWMDPVGLKALSVKPATKQYKWVGGQSITTGLNCFDGWFGDEWQSPQSLQKFYSEPIINLGDDYTDYCSPSYLPKPAHKKSSGLAVFSNPAKLSRLFLSTLADMGGKVCFIHRQYSYQKVRDRIEAVLGAENVSYICPESHLDALNAVNRFSHVIDTFPYSSGLTAREVVAMGSKVRVLRVGQLFSERHSARYYSSN